jgi:hypothetical protein
VSRTLSINDGRVQREIALSGTTLVGRDPECDISHADPRLSRRHAEFRVTAEGVQLRDLGSRNGTLVNGYPVDEILLTPGDVVQIAHLTMRFNDPTAGPTVHMHRGGHAADAAAALRPAIQDDRTRVISPAARAAAQASTAIDMPMPSLDNDRARSLSPPVARPQAGSVPRPPAAASSAPLRAPARLPQQAEVVTAGPVNDVGEVVLYDPSAQGIASVVSVDLSVYGLSGSRWGRHVLIQGLVLSLVVLLLTAAPLLAWEMRLYGSSVLSSWPVLLPVVVAALAAGVAVASLIARTTASGLASRGK